MHIIDAWCFSGSEMALIEIDALFLVFLLMIAGLQLTMICRSRRKFVTKQVTFEDEFMAENKLQT